MVRSFRVFSCLGVALVYERYGELFHLTLAWRPAVPYQTKSKTRAADEEKRAEGSHEVQTYPVSSRSTEGGCVPFVSAGPEFKTGPVQPGHGDNQPARRSAPLR